MNISHSEEWPFDLSKYADLGRKVIVKYRNGETEMVEITTVRSSKFSERFIVTFNAVERRLKCIEKHGEIFKITPLDNEILYTSNLYEKDGRVNNHSYSLSCDQYNKLDIIEVSLNLSGTGIFVETPAARFHKQD